jgi:hypothetical protein
MPGIDSAEATRIVAGELDVPHLVELPARGPGGDMLGRALALISATTGDFAAETTPTGWRLSGGASGAGPSRPMRRGAAWLAEDADRIEERLGGFHGQVKAQLAGPWTLAAGVEAVRGTRLLADPGACRALAEALAESVAAHVADLRRRLPAADLVLQVDEPSLPMVRSGGVRTPSGRGALRTPEPAELSAALGAVAAAGRSAGAGTVLAHCCARDVPFDLLAGSGYTAISLDLSALGTSLAELGQWWDRGGEVVLGVAPTTDPPAQAERAMPESLARRVAELWHRIGFDAPEVAARTWLSPTCGLAGASPRWSRRFGAVLRRTATMLADAS